MIVAPCASIVPATRLFVTNAPESKDVPSTSLGFAMCGIPRTPSDHNMTPSRKSTQLGSGSESTPECLQNTPKAQSPLPVLIQHRVYTKQPACSPLAIMQWIHLQHRKMKFSSVSWQCFGSNLQMMADMYMGIHLPHDFHNCFWSLSVDVPYAVGLKHSFPLMAVVCWVVACKFNEVQHDG